MLEVLKRADDNLSMGVILAHCQTEPLITQLMEDLPLSSSHNIVQSELAAVDMSRSHSRSFIVTFGIELNGVHSKLPGNIHMFLYAPPSHEEGTI